MAHNVPCGVLMMRMLDISKATDMLVQQPHHVLKHVMLYIAVSRHAHASYGYDHHRVVVLVC